MTLANYIRSVSILCLSGFVQLALANPESGTVIQGSVDIQKEGTRTVIEQHSPTAIINWNKFDIKAGETTHFEQPVNGVALNRITDGNVTKIYGSLTSTGRIILINGAGIYFGPNAYVNVGGIIASTVGITDDHFKEGIKRGQLIFDQPSAFQHANIVNKGTIKAADYGLVALVGNNVTNNGLIQANLGTVVMGSADQYTLSLIQGGPYDGLINFTIQAPASHSHPGVNNNHNGRIIADGGYIQIGVGAVSKVLDNVINLDGVVQANSVEYRDGVITILESDHGSYENSIQNNHVDINVKGKISVASTDEKCAGQVFISTYGDVNIWGEINGEGPHSLSSAIRIYADRINLKSGGKILMDALKGGAELYLHGHTDLNIEEGSLISANALKTSAISGIYLGSENTTTVLGRISATGGSESGDGGEITINGHDQVEFSKNIDVSAPHGTPGSWTVMINDEVVDHS